MQLTALLFNLTTTFNEHLHEIGVDFSLLRPILHDSLEIVREIFWSNIDQKPLFTQFQYRLLNTLLVLLVVNLFLIFIFWRKYGPGKTKTTKKKIHSCYHS